ncbi:hypothetical protein ACSBR2_029454 [Camellia fascicularis]
MVQTHVSVCTVSSTIHIDDTPTSSQSKRKFCRTTHEQRKKGQSEGASKLASSMENLASLVKSQQRDIRELIDKCLAKLYSLQGLDLEDMPIVFAVTLMDNPVNQAILLQLPIDEAVISWLRMKKSQNFGGPSAPT